MPTVNFVMGPSGEPINISAKDESPPVVAALKSGNAPFVAEFVLVHSSSMPLFRAVSTVSSEPQSLANALSVAHAEDQNIGLSASSFVIPVDVALLPPAAETQDTTHDQGV